MDTDPSVHIRALAASRDEIAQLAARDAMRSPDVIAALLDLRRECSAVYDAIVAERGPRKRHVKFSDETVAAIRASDEPGAVIARKYGCDPSFITKIRKGERRVTAPKKKSPEP